MSPTPKAEATLQAAITELVWFHGDDPERWSVAVYEGLVAKGIHPSQLTRKRLASAQRRCDEELQRRMRESKTEGTDALEVSWHASPDEASREVVIARLRELCDQKRRGGPPATQSVFRESVMTATTVRESEFRSLLRSIGFASATDAKKWDLKRLNTKVASPEAFNELIGKAKKAAEGAELDLLRNISDCLSEGGGVEVVADLQESNGHVEEQQVTSTSNEESAMTTATATAEPKATKKKNASTKGTKITPAKNGRGPTLIDGAMKSMKRHDPRRKGLKPKAIWEFMDKDGNKPEKYGKTPWATIGATMYTEIDQKGKDSRFAFGDEKGTFVLKS